MAVAKDYPQPIQIERNTTLRPPFPVVKQDKFAFKNPFFFEPSLTVYPKKYAHGFCSAVLCCGYTLTDFPISIRLTSLALWQSNDCPSASKATLMSMDKYFMWIHYERLHNHNKAKNNKTVCIFLGIYCKLERLLNWMQLWTSNAIWRHESGSTLFSVLAYCLTSPNRYLNQCRLTISDVRWHS